MPGPALPTPRAAKAAPVLVLLLAMASGACAARGGVPRPFPGAAIPPGAGDRSPERPESPPERVEALSRPAGIAPALTTLVTTALSFRGAPYRNGGSDPSGFDCSGFVQYVFGRLGVALPREVQDQYRIGREIDRDEVKPGDLLFFETVSRGASHVGMAVGGDEFVHAPSSRGVVRVERFSASYWARRFVGARRMAEPTAAATAGFPGAVRSAK